MQVIPDQIEPVVGWRSWNISDDSLVSPQQKTIWPKQEKIVAEKTGIKEEGINAFTEASLVCSRGYDVFPVIGQVALWGEVSAYERGYRADYAYPLCLWATDAKFENVVKQVASEYKVPYAGVAKIIKGNWSRSRKIALGILISKALALLLVIYALLPQAFLLLVCVPLLLGIAFWASLVYKWNTLMPSDRLRDYPLPLE